MFKLILFFAGCFVVIVAACWVYVFRIIDHFEPDEDKVLPLGSWPPESK